MAYHQFVALAVALPVIGCASATSPYDRVSRGWVGYKQAELVERWGKPHHDYAMEDGWHAIGYFFTAEVVRGPRPYREHMFLVSNCMVNFDVSPDGVVEGASTAGERCRIVPYGLHRRPVSQ